MATDFIPVTLQEFGNELKKWRLTKYKLINLSISIVAVLIYEFVARPYYLPFIYSHRINDFHIADTLGNSLGTIATLFFLVALLSNELQKGNYFIRLGTISLTVFELSHPMLGKLIDLWDIIATELTGFISHLIYTLFSRKK